jgi:hypothetical protein
LRAIKQTGEKFGQGKHQRGEIRGKEMRMREGR